MTITIVAIAALFISVLSLCLSAYSVLRDRSRLKATSIQYKWGPLRIRAVNRGRRPVILTMLRGEYNGGYKSGTYLGDKNEGIRLNERERYEINLDGAHHIVLTTHPESHEPLFAKNLWFEDTTGRRYRIKRIKRHLRKIT